MIIGNKYQSKLNHWNVLYILIQQQLYRLCQKKTYCSGNGIARDRDIDGAVQYYIARACAIALYVSEVNAIVDTYDIVFCVIMT